MAHSNRPLERTCIVTRRALPVARLIRFVAAPDGQVVADLRHRLPGRGAWVTAEAEHVRTAERRRLFARALGVPVTIEQDLSARVADALATAALKALALARKAGSVVSGFAKVDAALKRETVVGLIHAAEAGADGVSKLDSAARRRSGDGLPIIRLFAGEQLSLAFGSANVIHAALLAGPASANVLTRVQALADFVGEDVGASISKQSPPAEPTNLSAGR